MQRLIDDLIDTMRDANGAGLAANQVDEPVRIAVIEVDHNPRYPYKPPIPLTVVVNPVIEPLDDELVEINEGCLSVPDLRGNVDAPRERPGALPRPRRRRRTTRSSAGSPPARSSTRSTTSTACCSSTGSHDPTHAHHLGAVRALPPGRVRRADHRVRRAGRVVTAVTATGASWPGSAATQAEAGVVARGRRRPASSA